MSALKLRHYAAEPVALDRTRTYRHQRFDKPGGLWVSVLGEDDWPSWCRSEYFRIRSLSVEHEVTLTPAADILHLASASDLDDFTATYQIGGGGYPIDWQRVASDYQGIVIAPYQWSRRYDGDASGWYYSWDCASGCIWDLAAIESVTALTPAEVLR